MAYFRWTFQTKQYSYGSPILNNDGEIVGLVGKENAIIPVTEIQRAIVQAERLRPRATQGALERASQELVNAVMGEEYDAFSTFLAPILPVVWAFRSFGVDDTGEYCYA